MDDCGRSARTALLGHQQWPSTSHTKPESRECSRAANCVCQIRQYLNIEEWRGGEEAPRSSSFPVMVGCLPRLRFLHRLTTQETHCSVLRCLARNIHCFLPIIEALNPRPDLHVPPSTLRSRCDALPRASADPSGRMRHQRRSTSTIWSVR